MSKQLVTFEFLVINSILVMNILPQQYKIFGYLACSIPLFISYKRCHEAAK